MTRVILLALIASCSETKSDADRDRERADYVRSIEDSMRETIPSARLELVGDFKTIIELQVPGCSREMLETVIGPKKVRDNLDAMGFSALRCAGGGGHVTKPWR